MSGASLVESLPAGHPMHILEPVFTEPQGLELPMPSGRVMHGGADERLVLIKDHSDGTRFMASYTSASFGRAIMKASIRVKNAAGERNTDLYAGLLLERSLEYFDSVNKRPVTGFEAIWVNSQDPDRYSDNYAAYRRIVEAEQTPSPHTRAQAARSTWTGGQMERLGFDRITSIVDRPYGSITTTFERSSVLGGVHDWVSKLRSQRYK